MVSPIVGRTVIDIKATVQKQGANAEQLLAVHLITGCDTVSYMCGIGKATALKKMQAGHLIKSLGQEEADVSVIVSEQRSWDMYFVHITKPSSGNLP